MPVTSGEEASRELRLIRRRYQGDSFQRLQRGGGHSAHFPGKGLAGFIQKPYTSAKLAQCIKRVFERANSADGG